VKTKTTQEPRTHQRDSAAHKGKTNIKSSENIRLINSSTLTQKSNCFTRWSILHRL